MISDLIYAGAGLFIYILKLGQISGGCGAEDPDYDEITNWIGLRHAMYRYKT